MLHVSVFFSADGREWGHYLANLLRNKALDLKVETFDVTGVIGDRAVARGCQAALLKVMIVSPEFLSYFSGQPPAWMPDCKDSRQNVMLLLCAVEASQVSKYCRDSNWKICNIENSDQAVRKLVRDIGKAVDDCEERGPSPTQGIKAPVPTPRQKPSPALSAIEDTTIPSRCPRVTPTHVSRHAPPTTSPRPRVSQSNAPPQEDVSAKRLVAIPVRAKFRIHRVLPAKITVPGEEVTIIFIDSPSGEEAIEVDIKGIRVCPKEVNPFTYVLKAPDGLCGKVPMQIYRGSERLNVYPLMFESPDMSAFSYIGMLAQTLSIPTADTDALDQKLLELLNRTVPGGNLDCLFSNLMFQEQEPTEKSDQKLPTVLHFAAFNGLKELSCRLLELPGSLLAYRLENSDGCDPAELADSAGHSELAEYLRNFVETQITVDMADNLYVAMSGHSLLYENTRPHVTEPRTGLYDYTPMEFRHKKPPQEAEDDDCDESVYLKGHPTLLIKDRLPPKQIPRMNSEKLVRRKEIPLPKASTIPRGYCFGDETPTPGTVGSRSQEELKQIQIMVSQGTFSMDDSQRLFEAWKLRYAAPTSSFTERQKALEELRKTFKSTLKSAEESKQKSTLGAFLTRVRSTRNKEDPRGKGQRGPIDCISSPIYEEGEGADDSIYSHPDTDRASYGSTYSDSSASGGSRSSRTSTGSSASSGLGSSLEELQENSTYSLTNLCSRNMKRSRLSRREKASQGLRMDPAPSIPARQRPAMPLPPRRK